MPEDRSQKIKKKHRRMLGYDWGMVEKQASDGDLYGFVALEKKPPANEGEKFVPCQRADQFATRGTSSQHHTQAQIVMAMKLNRLPVLSFGGLSSCVRAHKQTLNWPRCWIRAMNEDLLCKWCIYVPVECWRKGMFNISFLILQLRVSLSPARSGHSPRTGKGFHYSRSLI